MNGQLVGSLGLFPEEDGRAYGYVLVRGHRGAVVAAVVRTMRCFTNDA